MKQLYTKITLMLALIVMCSTSGFSQNGRSLWTKTTQSKAVSLEQVFRKTQPNAASFYQLDLASLKSVLQSAPKRGDVTSTSTVIVDFPTVNGKLESFRVMEASIMDPALQAQFPNIRSYVGQSITNPADVMRFSITPQGLNTMLLSSEGTQMIDPYTKTGDFYIVYAKRDLPMLDEPFVCDFVNDDNLSTTVDFDIDAARNANDGQLRTYQLALACTIEYATFHVNAAGLQSGTLAQKKAAVLAAMNVTMTRVNGIYEREFSLTMVIVPNNLDIIFITSDNFNNNDAGTLINQSQTVIDQIIGNANYDIGHTFSTGGGGLAGVNVPCVTGSKARGITGSPAPVGDAYDIDFVAHEMGHQFGSNHTFNGNAGNCAGGNRSAQNAYEPGSGTTIMAYAGICAPQDVQQNSDDYFHQRSIVTIWANISAGNSSTCSTNTATGNAAPTAEAGPNFTIPKSTPYKLTGSSTDSDGIGSHTYTWEQYDLGPAGIPTETTASGPLVRSVQGTTNPTRYVPSLQDLINTGGSTTWEKLVSVARPINFKLTVRDNDVRGGQTAVDNMTAATITAAGPFVVTSQAEDGISWVQNSTETITWDVAGTTGNGINTANVNILLSTDGGLTYPITLASNTPNDGSQPITVPDVIQPYCRVMVEAVGNIFFNINSNNFSIGGVLTTVCNQFASADNLGLAIPDGNGTTTPAQGTPIFNSINVTGSEVINNLKLHVDISHTSIGDILIQLQHPNGNAFNNVWSGNCGSNDNLDIIFSDLGNPLVCASPTTGTYIPFSPLSIYNGLNTQGTWRLAVVDFFQGNVGTLNDWYLEFCSTTFMPLGVNDFTAENFSIFPNPNNGEFTIKLNSSSGKDISVEVYDVRGRSIFNNKYNNTSSFNQTIQLNSVQSGMYLVKISDGDRQATKKIIVN